MGLIARLRTWLTRLLSGAGDRPPDTEAELMRFFGGNGTPNGGLEGSAR